jgi:cobalt-zinc-cadmium efflux system outer membrane protein
MRTLTTLIALGAVLTVSATPIDAEQQPVPQNASSAAVTLADLERLALETNPTLRAAEARVDASRNRARQAGAWPNPTVGYSGEEIRLSDIDRRGEHGFFVAQSIRLGGKLRLNRAAFDRATEQTEAELEMQRLRITSSTRSAFYRTLAAERRVGRPG